MYKDEDAMHVINMGPTGDITHGDDETGPCNSTPAIVVTPSTPESQPFFLQPSAEAITAMREKILAGKNLVKAHERLAKQSRRTIVSSPSC